MIGRGDIKMEAARENTESSLAERDYVEGWMLHAIASSSIAPMIAFKGGTALSRSQPNFGALVSRWRFWFFDKKRDHS